MKYNRIFMEFYNKNTHFETVEKLINKVENIYL
jgi:hypothetical protein